MAENLLTVGKVDNHRSTQCLFASNILLVRASPRRRRRSRTRSPSRSTRSRSRERKPADTFARSLGGPMNADHEEAVEFAKISKRENRVYVGNLSYDIKYRDLMEFMRGGGWGNFRLFVIFSAMFGPRVLFF